MTDKKEAQDLDMTYKVYTKLQLQVTKMSQFTPHQIPELVISGMRQLKPFKGLTGVQKREKLISLIQLLIKEHDTLNEFEGYDIEILYSMINSLYSAGILKRCCIC
jgi:hypothetical protein